MGIRFPISSRAKPFALCALLQSTQIKQGTTFPDAVSVHVFARVYSWTLRVPKVQDGNIIITPSHTIIILHAVEMLRQIGRAAAKVLHHIQDSRNIFKYDYILFL